MHELNSWKADGRIKVNLVFGFVWCWPICSNKSNPSLILYTAEWWQIVEAATCKFSSNLFQYDDVGCHAWFVWNHSLAARWFELTQSKLHIIACCQPVINALRFVGASECARIWQARCKGSGLSVDRMPSSASALTDYAPGKKTAQQVRYMAARASSTSTFATGQSFLRVDSKPLECN